MGQKAIGRKINWVETNTNKAEEVIADEIVILTQKIKEGLRKWQQGAEDEEEVSIMKKRTVTSKYIGDERKREVESHHHQEVTP